MEQSNIVDVVIIEKMEQSKIEEKVITEKMKLSKIEEVVKTLRQSFKDNETKSLKWRKQNLLSLQKLIVENEEDLCAAVKKDLNKAKLETHGMELGLIKNAITHALKNLESKMKPKQVYPIIQGRALYSTYVQSQPYGVVFIIGAWNYPYQLTLLPLVGAIACGNCALVKPSELSKNSALLLEHLWPKYFNTSNIALINGGISETTALLKMRFDYIFYTGSTAVGKIIMKAASEYLTPVTLECGGKSPCYVDSNADLELTAKRLLWGKFANVGQTCVAPDYVLCTKETQEKLLPLMKKNLFEFYGEQPKDSESYGRIINERHFQRLINLLDKSKIEHGGDTDEAEKYISPTIMTGVTLDDKIMQEEIFGPILPIVNVKDTQEAIDFINEGEKPLALYVFASSSSIFDLFKEQTTSGSFAFNEVLMQISYECLPFGGVGNSGIGNYHGDYSFDTFSHQRAVLYSNGWGDKLTFFRYPPYTDKNLKMMGPANTEMKCNIL